jgi:hypothetical protein
MHYFSEQFLVHPISLATILCIVCWIIGEIVVVEHDITLQSLSRILFLSPTRMILQVLDRHPPPLAIAANM